MTVWYTDMLCLLCLHSPDGFETISSLLGPNTTYTYGIPWERGWSPSPTTTSCFDLLRVDQAEFWTLNIAIFTGDSGILRFQTTVSKHHITLPFACNLLIFLKSITNMYCTCVFLFFSSLPTVRLAWHVISLTSSRRCQRPSVRKCRQRLTITSASAWLPCCTCRCTETSPLCRAPRRRRRKSHVGLQGIKGRSGFDSAADARSV